MCPARTSVRRAVLRSTSVARTVKTADGYKDVSSFSGTEALVASEALRAAYHRTQTLQAAARRQAA